MGPQKGLGPRYRPSYPVEIFLSEALSLGRSQWRIQGVRGQRDFTPLAKSLKKFNLKVRVLECVLIWPEVRGPVGVGEFNSSNDFQICALWLLIWLQKRVKCD